MAHGAPDHTRLSDDAFSHYTDKWSYLVWGALVAGDPANYIINTSMVGLLGDIYVLATHPMTTLKIEVDGAGVYAWDFVTLVTLGLWGYNNSQIKMNCTRYDSTLNFYAMVFNAQHEIYVHKTLKAWLVRGAPGASGSGYCWYKQKI